LPCLICFAAHDSFDRVVENDDDSGYVDQGVDELEEDEVVEKSLGPESKQLLTPLTFVYCHPMLTLLSRCSPPKSGPQVDEAPI
jgi:hypothetical protein